MCCKYALVFTLENITYVCGGLHDNMGHERWNQNRWSIESIFVLNQLKRSSKRFNLFVATGVSKSIWKYLTWRWACASNASRLESSTNISVISSIALNFIWYGVRVLSLTRAISHSFSFSKFPTSHSYITAVFRHFCHSMYAVCNVHQSKLTSIQPSLRCILVQKRCHSSFSPSQIFSTAFLWLYKRSLPHFRTDPVIVLDLSMKWGQAYICSVSCNNNWNSSSSLIRIQIFRASNKNYGDDTKTHSYIMPCVCDCDCISKKCDIYCTTLHLSKISFAFYISNVDLRFCLRD